MDIVFKKNIASFKLHYIKEVDSTNTYLKSHSFELDSRSVLYTDNQIAGKGRMTHTWDSSSCLPFSIIFKDDNRYEIISCLVIMNVLRKHNIKAFIKWPNDIYVDDKKICGILAESSYLGSELEYIVLGIGLNLEPKEEFNATGINEYIKISKEEILDEILLEFDRLLKISIDDLMPLYRNNNIIMNREIIHEGNYYKVIDFTKEGYLVVIDKDNNKKIINSNEINIKKSLIGGLNGKN
jgi:BirA family transcriptional regulator, biotin operon repressor / biotin---[acetyl-CoA-carboxylase] ligase